MQIKLNIANSQKLVSLKCNVVLQLQYYSNLIKTCELSLVYIIRDAIVLLFYVPC